MTTKEPQQAPPIETKPEPSPPPPPKRTPGGTPPQGGSGVMPKPPEKPKVAPLNVGDVVEVRGVPCTVVHINSGKNRFSLSPKGTLVQKVTNPYRVIERNKVKK